jgi:hypothetical protein
MINRNQIDPRRFLIGGAWAFCLAAVFALYASLALQARFGHSHFLQDRSNLWRPFFGGGPQNEALNLTTNLTGAIILLFAWWMLWKFDSFFMPVHREETEQEEEPSPGEEFSAEEEGEEKRQPGTNSSISEIDPEEENFAKILGLVGDYVPEDAKSSYRSLIAQYHPDKVSLMGDEIREVAERKAKEINEAYEFFRRKYEL